MSISIIETQNIGKFKINDEYTELTSFIGCPDLGLSNPFNIEFTM